MILQRLLKTLAERGSATPEELAHLLGSSPDAVRSMLQTLRRKGLVRRLAGGDCGRQCQGCGAEAERFAQVESGAGDHLPAGQRRA